MSRKVTVNIERCMGCHTCELACAIAHSESKDLQLMVLNGERAGYRIHVESYGPRAIPLSCQHCEEPACVLACPTGAVSRLAPGKPVLVDEERCIGCGMCVQACPFGVMAMSPTGKTAFKCDLCITRLAQGLLPACVASCPTQALRLEEEGETNRDKRKAAVARLAEAQAAGAQEQLAGG
ncbi:MAG: 4Fe-4S binding protein [Spirochaetales bacterium]|nr:4Fe-4S binding protein [Spirochaetales bacterium]